MGLFDGIRSKIQPVFDAQKAIMTIVVSAIRADGAISEEEVRRLHSMCARSPVFSQNTVEQDDRLIDFAVDVGDQFGDDCLRLAAEALEPALRQTAFAFATEMVLADGIVGDEEETYMAALAGILGLNENLARAIIEVTLIRARAA